MAKITSQEVENLIFKIGGFLKTIEPYKDAVEKVSMPIEAGVKKYEDAMKGDLIVSENETINKMWALAKFWKSQLNAFFTKDENYWMDKSGVNMFNRASIHTAANNLQRILLNLKDMRQASDACIDMIYALDFADHMDVKGWSSMFVSTKALDIEARKEATREFRDCMGMIDRIMQALNRSINCLQRFN